MAKRGGPKGLIALMLPLMFIFGLILIMPALYGSAEEERPANETAHPEQVAGIHRMLQGGNIILPSLATILVLAMVFVAFKTWRIRS
jgi:predicted metal-dependent RNase